MFEMDILYSIKKMIGSSASDEKISQVKISSHSPKKSRDLPAPLYEDAIAENNTINLRFSNSDDNDTIAMSVLSSPGNTHALSQQKEIRTGVTPGLLKKILKSTEKAKQMNPTQELALHGSQMSAPETVDSKRMKQLRSSCPSMTTLILQSLNLRAKQKNRRIRLKDFPANIERLSLRNSTFEPRTFFAKMGESNMEKLRVLDVGRAIYAQESNSSPEADWPRLKNLEELFLEGSPHTKSASFLEALLANFPRLEVLDLEGTELREDDLKTVARLAPNLRELYLGHTGLRDRAVMQLVQSGFGFEKLAIICLCETGVTDMGLDSLLSVCPSLRSITAKRSLVGSKAAEALEESLAGLKVYRVEITHIYAVFRDRGCDHFTMKYGSPSNDAQQNPYA